MIMAVRNLEAITRQGNLLAAQKANEKKIRDDNFWRRVELIRDTKPQAVDAVDTIKAMYEHGLYGKLENWLTRTQQNGVQISCGNPIRFRISRDRCFIYYEPKDGVIEFAWSDHGMCESYTTRNANMDYVINAVTKDNRSYDTLLTAMAAWLPPFLDDFFKWVDTL